VHQIRFRPGFRLGSRWGAFGAPQTLGLRGPTSQGNGKEDNGRGEEGMEGEETGDGPLTQIPGCGPWFSHICCDSFIQMFTVHGDGIRLTFTEVFIQQW